MAKFLCCLPVRLGTLVIAFFQFLINGISAGILWFVLVRASDDERINLTRGQTVTIVITGIVSSIATIVSIFGFIGALAKKLSFVKSFVTILYYLLGFHFGSGLANIIVYAIGKDNALEQCSSNGFSDDTCRYSYKVLMGTLVGAMIIPLLLDAYACYVVGGYAKKLQKMEFKRNTVSFGLNDSNTGNAYNYARAGTADDSVKQPLTDSYPYAQAQHSYGNSSYSDNANHTYGSSR